MVRPLPVSRVGRAGACGITMEHRAQGMAIRLTLICHAAMPARRGVAFLQDGPADPEQLARAAGMARALGRIERLWTAPELRARQTAAALGPGATVMPALRD